MSCYKQMLCLNIASRFLSTSKPLARLNWPKVVCWEAGVCIEALQSDPSGVVSIFIYFRCEPQALGEPGMSWPV